MARAGRGYPSKQPLVSGAVGTAFSTLTRTVTDTAIASDVAVGSVTESRTVTETVTATDTVARAVVVSRPVIDTAIATDSVSRSAFPTVINVAGTAVGATLTSQVITMPTSIVAGRLLLAAVFSSVAVTPSAGWATIGTFVATVNAAYRFNVFAKSAAGADALTVSAGSGFVAAAGVFQIDAWSGATSDIKFASTLSTLDPPSLSMGANGNNLWVAGCINFTAGNTAPTSYGNLLSQPAGSGFIVTARRALTALSEDPGVFGGTPATPDAFTIGIAPALASTLTLSRTIADTASASDAATRSGAVSRSVTDTATASDTAVRGGPGTRAATDTATATDTLTRFVVVSRPITDTTSATDTLTRFSVVFRPVTDTATGTDAAARSAQSFARIAIDTASATDTLTRATTKSRTVVDTATGTDAASRSAQSFARAASDTATATDVATHPSSGVVRSGAFMAFF